MADSFSLEPARRESSLSWVWKLFGAGTKEKTTPITVPKYPSTANDVNLAVALQYGTAQGLVQLQKFIKEFVGNVYQPAFADWTTLIHCGNTDAWSRCVITLCNRGDLILAEEWTYPSAMSSSQPFGVGVVPVAMDSEGMRADDLRKVLSEWDEAARGAKRFVNSVVLRPGNSSCASRRPHVMYTVPVGQNPSGAVSGLYRCCALWR